MNSNLDSIPSEVLEKIAYFAAVQPAFDEGAGDLKIGPPSSLIPLLTINRRTNEILNISSNHHLYSSIFEHQFDLDAVRRRIGHEKITSSVLALELKRRWPRLKWLRAQVDAAEKQRNSNHNSRSNVIINTAEDALFEGLVTFRDEGKELRLDALWTAYLMMLENDGKNARQMREYAKMESWLQDFWFDDHKASLTKVTLGTQVWPDDSEENALAMWLFWMLFKPSKYDSNYASFWNMTSMLKILALGAHKYELADPPWESFHPNNQISQSRVIEQFSIFSSVAPPPLATPAILSFLSFVSKALSFSAGNLQYQSPNVPSCTNPPSFSIEWDSEWQKCLSLGRTIFESQLSKSFKLGTIEGSWEGMFTYSEFGTYTSLLLGAPPQELINSLVVQHRQTWKLREYYYFTKRTPSQVLDDEAQAPLSPGDPLRSYCPTGSLFEEHSSTLIVREPGRRFSLQYLRACSEEASNQLNRGNTVQDVIIFGEGHSAWGQFGLVGRVRPCDGFISLTKEYVGAERGSWLYRGYLVGDQFGNLAGRWRDTRTPANMLGYEGCFVMSQRN